MQQPEPESKSGHWKEGRGKRTPSNPISFHTKVKKVPPTVTLLSDILPYSHLFHAKFFFGEGRAQEFSQQKPTFSIPIAR